MGYLLIRYFEQDDGTGHLLLPNVLHSLANYSNTIPAASTGTEAGGTEEGAAAPAAPAKGGANMGTFIGVYLPCIQNIFGVILFIRLTWVVGTAGAFCGFVIVLMCCCIVSWIIYF